MKIVYKSPKDLVPYENNSRRHPEHQIVALMKAITEFGFDQPIVIDKHNVVIKGHGRLEAALRLDLKKVPVVVKAVEDNDAKLLRVLDNSMVSEQWDYHALQQEVDTLAGSNLDIEATGFTMDDLTNLPVGEEVVEEEVPAVRVVTPTRTCKHCGYKF